MKKFVLIFAIACNVLSATPAKENRQEIEFIRSRMDRKIEAAEKKLEKMRAQLAVEQEEEENEYYSNRLIKRIGKKERRLNDLKESVSILENRF